MNNILHVTRRLWIAHAFIVGKEVKGIFSRVGQNTKMISINLSLLHRTNRKCDLFLIIEYGKYQKGWFCIDLLNFIFLFGATCYNELGPYETKKREMQGENLIFCRIVVTI